MAHAGQTPQFGRALRRAAYEDRIQYRIGVARDDDAFAGQHGSELLLPVLDSLPVGNGLGGSHVVPGDEPLRDERDRERDDVGDHVRGVGEQREGAEEETADELDDEEDRVEHERERECVRAVGREVVRVTVAGSRVVVGCRATTVPPGKQC